MATNPAGSANQNASHMALKAAAIAKAVTDGANMAATTTRRSERSQRFILGARDVK